MKENNMRLELEREHLFYYKKITSVRTSYFKISIKRICSLFLPHFLFLQKLNRNILALNLRNNMVGQSTWSSNY